MTEDPEFTPDVLAEFDQTTDADAELEWLMEHALLRRYSRAFSEAARLDTAATQAEGQP